MEHKLDDFFREKIESAEDNLPENSTFDEQLFWGQLQKNLDKPQRKGWWKWVTMAACLGGLVLWVVSIFYQEPATRVISHARSVRTTTMKPDCSLAVVYPKKIKSNTHKPKKKEIIESKKDLNMEVEQLVVKATPMQAPTIKQDSIHFKPIIAEIKPQFKTIHVNEISNTEKASIPQPKFKIRFAARN